MIVAVSYWTHLALLAGLTVAGIAVVVLGEWATRRTGGVRGRSGNLWDRQHADG